MKPVVIIALAFVFSFTIIPFVYAERDCPEDRICAFPKDFLEYKISTIKEFKYGDTETFGTPTFTKIEFGNMANDNIIYVRESGIGDTETFGVDLRTGFQNDRNDFGEYLRFISVMKIPISIGDEVISSDPFVTPAIFEYESTFDYKGQTRPSIVAVQEEDEGFTWNYYVDKETGILLQQILKVEVTSGYIITSEVLFDTNMITEKPQPQEIVESVQKIPDWVKNSMKWFIDGVISEDEMISALQFLIKEGIIKVV